MQLKITRSQRESGVFSKSVVFCLNARAEFTPAEQASLSRYKLFNEVIYSSQAAERYAARGDAQHAQGSTGGYLKAIANYAMARLQLNVTVGSLANGQYIECKSLDELIEAGEAIMTACQNLKSYLAVAATFDGGEVLYEFFDTGPVALAQSVAPQPALLSATPAVTIPPAAPAPALPPAPAPAGYEAAPAEHEAVLAEYAAAPAEAWDSGDGYQTGFRALFDPGPAGDQQMRNVLIIGGIILFLLLVAWAR